MQTAGISSFSPAMTTAGGPAGPGSLGTGSVGSGSPEPELPERRLRSAIC